MLLTVEGTYQNGQIRLNDDIPFKTETKVIVTFLNDTETRPKKIRLSADSFSFKKTRNALKDHKGSFSDELINERRQSR